MKISRRDMILRFGPAAALLHPLLRATRAEAQVAPKKRFVTFFASSGVEQEVLINGAPSSYDGAPFTPSFWPAGKGGRFDSGSYSVTGKSTEPLAPFLSECIFLKGLRNGAEAGDAHNAGTVSLLTGQGLRLIPEGTPPPYAKGESMDGILAAAAPAYVREKLLNLAVRPVTGRPSSYLSYLASGQHRQPRVNPYDTFTRIMAATFNAACGGGSGGITPPDARTLRKHGILDSMRKETASMKQYYGLGAEERARLERLEDGIRAIETGIAGLPPGGAPPGLTALRCQALRKDFDEEGRVAITDANYPNILKLQLDLIALAFELDVSRVATLHLSTGGPSGPAMRWLQYTKPDGSRVPIEEAHHDITHGMRRKVADMHRKLPVIDRWHMQQFAYLLKALTNIKEGGQSVLDQSIVWFTSDVAVGARHTTTNLPVIVAGRAGGALKPGYFQELSGTPRLQRLLLKFFELMGMPRATFGNPALSAGGPLSIGG